MTLFGFLKLSLCLGILFLQTIAWPRGFSQPSWLAFGDIRGNFEPCGCDPTTDLGGIDRLGAYIQIERQVNPDLPLVFSTGNNFSIENSSLAAKKNDAIKKALSVFDLDAALWNETENSYLGMKQISSGKNYFLTNQSKVMNSSKSLPSFIRIASDRVLVFGFVEPVYTHAVEYDLDVDRFSERVKSLKQEDQKFSSILLFSGNDKTLSKILKKISFDEVLVSNNFDLSKKFDDFQRRDEKKLNLNISQRPVRIVPVGGQGVLRSGALAKQPPPKSLVSLFTKDEKREVVKTEVPAFGSFYGVAWLSSEMGSSSTQGIVQAIAEYRLNSASQMNSLIESRLIDLKSSEFVGSERCSTCHESSYDVWKKSKHGQALDTIYKVNRQNDPECVSCHVIGFAQRGGFVSREHSPHLQHVGCESCHGPRKAHVENPSIKHATSNFAKESCKSCHTPPHSPKYNYDTYWKLIEHK
jgi:hypothetical protein